VPHPSEGTALRLDPNSDVISSKVKGICSECIVLSAQTDISTKDGFKKDIGSGVYSHHIIMTSIGHVLIRPPTSIRCSDGRTGGFNFSGMGPKGQGSAPTGGAMAGMSHGGAAPAAPSGHGHSKRQTAPKLPGLPPSVFVGQGDDGSPMVYRSKGSPIKSGFYVQKTDEFNLMSYGYTLVQPACDLERIKMLLTATIV
jgi:hypothetical protein